MERIPRWDEPSLEGLQPLIVAPQEGTDNVTLRKITWLPQDNGLLIASHREGRASILETESLRCAEIIKVTSGSIWSHAVSIFTHANVAFATSHYARIADLRAGCCVQSVGRGPSTSLCEVEWIPGEEFQLQLSYEDCRVEVWDIRKTGKVPLVALRCPFQGERRLRKSKLFGSTHVFCSTLTESGSTPSSPGEIAFISLQNREPVWMQQYTGGTGGFCIIENVPVPLLAMEGPRMISFLNLWNGELEFNENVEFDTFGLIFNTKREEFYSPGPEWDVYVYGSRYDERTI